MRWEVASRLASSQIVVLDCRTSYVLFSSIVIWVKRFIKCCSFFEVCLVAMFAHRHTFVNMSTSVNLGSIYARYSITFGKTSIWMSTIHNLGDFFISIFLIVMIRNNCWFKNSSFALQIVVIVIASFALIILSNLILYMGTGLFSLSQCLVLIYLFRLTRIIWRFWIWAADFDQQVNQTCKTE